MGTDLSTPFYCNVHETEQTGSLESVLQWSLLFVHIHIHNIHSVATVAPIIAGLFLFSKSPGNLYSDHICTQVLGCYGHFLIYLVVVPFVVSVTKVCVSITTPALTIDTGLFLW